jgi:hypothetical protein
MIPAMNLSFRRFKRRSDGSIWHGLVIDSQNRVRLAQMWAHQYGLGRRPEPLTLTKDDEGSMYLERTQLDPAAEHDVMMVLAAEAVARGFEDMQERAQRGLFPKYDVHRADGKPLKGGSSIVLEIGDPNAWPALAVWAQTVRGDGHLQLAQDVEQLLDEQGGRAHVHAIHDLPIGVDVDPDVQALWDDFWSPIVAPGGVLDIRLVMRELADFKMMIGEVPKVYDEATNGRISKPNTSATAVIEVMREVRAADLEPLGRALRLLFAAAASESVTLSPTDVQAVVEAAFDAGVPDPTRRDEG